MELEAITSGWVVPSGPVNTVTPERLSWKVVCGEKHGPAKRRDTVRGKFWAPG